jgi:hypothetical protein
VGVSFQDACASLTPTRNAGRRRVVLLLRMAV